MLPRLPIRFISTHTELLKNLEASSGGKAGATDYSSEESVPNAAVIEPQFRAPGDRNLGNVLFRRNLDGTLDLRAAKDVVVDIIRRAKDQLPLTELEKIVLGVLMPTVFGFVDARLVGALSSVHLRLAPFEIVQINQAVAAHLAEEMNYNAGLGGGSEPGRSETRS